jgi:amino acid transporter
LKNHCDAHRSPVIGTGLIGWLLNVVLVLCSGPIGGLPGPSENAFLAILVLRLGKPGALVLWVRAKAAFLSTKANELQSLVCLTAFFVVQTGLQANSRTLYAFSRDRGSHLACYSYFNQAFIVLILGFPDGGLLAKISPRTQTPLIAVWVTTILSILPGLLDLASLVAANAIFSLCAIALDSSYVIPIFLYVPLSFISYIDHIVIGGLEGGTIATTRKSTLSLVHSTCLGLWGGLRT